MRCRTHMQSGGHGRTEAPTSVANEEQKAHKIVTTHYWKWLEFPGHLPGKHTSNWLLNKDKIWIQEEDTEISKTFNAPCIQ